MIDVSEFQGTIDWGKVKAGTRVYARASYGSTGVDKQVTANVRGAFKAGCVVGLYHFQEDNDPHAEMAHFLQVAKMALPAGHHYGLRPALDVESSSFSHPNKANVVAAVNALHGVLNYYPTLYGNPSDLGRLGLPKAIAACPLWLADYGVNDGSDHGVQTIPPPWNRVAAHQYTSVGHYPGIAGHVDLNTVSRPIAIDVPKPRLIIDKWQVSYVPKRGARKKAWTRTPYLYLKVRRAERRGRVTIYPHRREA